MGEQHAFCYGDGERLQAQSGRMRVADIKLVTIKSSPAKRDKSA